MLSRIEGVYTLFRDTNISFVKRVCNMTQAQIPVIFQDSQNISCLSCNISSHNECFKFSILIKNKTKQREYGQTVAYIYFK